MRKNPGRCVLNCGDIVPILFPRGYDWLRTRCPSPMAETTPFRRRNFAANRLHMQQNRVMQSLDRSQGKLAVTGAIAGTVSCRPGAAFGCKSAVNAARRG